MGGDVIFAHGETNARGTAILVKKGFPCKIDKIQVDHEGRSVSCMITHNDINVALTNIYAPNKDSPGFYEEKINYTVAMHERAIIVGDFNTVIDPTIDRRSGSKINVNPKSTVKLNELMKTHILEDVWRIQNEGKARYSWYRMKLDIQASRIDYGLISAGLCDNVHDTFYLTGLNTDHSAYFIGLDIEHHKRGPGFWKLNTLHLKNPEFILAVAAQIDQKLKENAALDPVNKWESLKAAIKQTCKQLSKAKISEENLIISQLCEKTTEMESKIEQLTENEQLILQQSREELEELMAKKTRAAMFRSKAQWNIESEKNSKYFYNLERARYNAKTCQAVYDDENNLVHGQQQILETQRKFYQELYTKDENVRFNISADAPQVEQDSISASEIPFTIEEIAESVKSLRNGSCPGSDGLPIEIYKMFWNNIKTAFHEYVTAVHQVECMNSSAQKGVLNLIPKGNKDTRFLKNMRPITLLNCDYKVIEKTIANRMITGIDQVVSQDQTGFIPGRRIAANIRKILDLIHTAEQEENNSLILTCDWMKCFDRIEHDAVYRAMQMFGFSEYLIKWVRIVYSRFRIKVQNNGQFSKEMDITWGLHQGGPASNVLFLVVAELLAIRIKADSEIKGIFVKEILQLLNQYADDTDVCSIMDESSYRAIITQLQDFGHHTGFKLNYDKTTVYRIGSARESNAKYYTEPDIKWTSETINVLGIDISHDVDTQLSVNYEKVIDRAQTILQKWENRHMSMIGKIEIINTMVALLFVYRMTVLPAIPMAYVNRLQKMCEDFIWNGKKPKIPTELLQAKKTDRGQKLMNMRIKDTSIKATWPKLVMQEVYPSRRVYNYLIPELGPEIWCCNLKSEDVEHLGIKNIFWKDVLKAWCRYHYTPEVVMAPQIIWLNSNIRVNNHPIWWPNIATSGLRYVHQLMDNGKFKSHEVVLAEYNLPTMEYNMIKSAVPAKYKEDAKGREHMLDICKKKTPPNLCITRYYHLQTGNSRN